MRVFGFRTCVWTLPLLAAWSCTKPKQSVTQTHTQTQGNTTNASGSPSSGAFLTTATSTKTSGGTINGQTATAASAPKGTINGQAVQAAVASGGTINGQTVSSSSTGPSTIGHAPFAAPPAGYSLSTVQGWAAQASGMKVVYIPPENINDKDMVNELRVAMGKTWNHLSFAPNIDVPKDISNGAGLAFALDINKMWGSNAQTNWGYIANCTPKANIDVSPASTIGCDTFDANQPVSIPRFVFNATNGGPYANIMQTPPDFSSFQQKFSLGPIKYVSTAHEAIVCGPRIIAYRPVTINGVNTWYAWTSDEFQGRDEGNINYTTAPGENDQRQTGSFNAGPGDGDTAIAAEWWIQLPNGFMYWGIHGEGSQERGKAEFPFAIDPANWKQNDDLSTGRSCITCHVQGTESSKNDPDKQGQNGWAAQSDLDAFYATQRGKFQAALKALVVGLSDGSDDLNNRIINGTIEPVSRAIMLIEGPYTPGQNDCSGFCVGKYGPSRQNLCETLPAR